MHLAFESILDFPSFALRIPQADMERVPDILLAVPPEKVAELQRGLARVWRRCEAWRRGIRSENLRLPRQHLDHIACIWAGGGMPPLLAAAWVDSVGQSVSRGALISQSPSACAGSPLAPRPPPQVCLLWVQALPGGDAASTQVRGLAQRGRGLRRDRLHLVSQPTTTCRP